MTTLQKIGVATFALVMSIILFNSFAELGRQSDEEADFSKVAQMEKARAEMQTYKDSLRFSRGDWVVSKFVDDFGDPTDRPYMRVSLPHDASFSNSVVNEANLYGELFVEKNRAFIRLFEYNRSTPANSLDYSKPKLAIRSGNENEVIFGTGTARGDFLISRKQFEKFRSFISDKDKTRMVLKSDFATYKFDLTTRGFMAVWPEIQ